MRGGRGEAHRVDEGAAAHGRHVRVAAQSCRLHGLVQDGNVQGIVFHRLAAGQHQGRASQGDDLRVGPAIALDVRQQVGVVPVEAPVHHGQHLLGSSPPPARITS